MSIRFLTAGDSHGEMLVGIIEGLPAGVRLVIRDIQKELSRRRRSYGRSSRQIIEGDESPVGLRVSFVRLPQLPQAFGRRSGPG